MENFKSLETIADAKAEIFAHLETQSVAVLNADDPLVRTMNPGPGVTKSFFGMRPGVDVRLSETGLVTLEGQRFGLFCGEHELSVELKAPGEHNRMNAAAAAALGIAAGASFAAVVEGLAAFRPGMMRSELISLSDGSLLLDDCYNASPRAFEEALNTLRTLPRAGRRIVAMGDMLELGADSMEFHRLVGEQAAELGVDVFFGYGPLSRHAVQAFKKRAPTKLCGHFTDLGRVFEELVKSHAADDVILVKGSRGMRMERLTEQLKKLSAAVLGNDMYPEDV
jgi:UDP-N-acetylmuramoyl-tripeptide--D-alanyl-D-alanine ligase